MPDACSRVLASASGYVAICASVEDSAPHASSDTVVGSRPCVRRNSALNVLYSARSIAANGMMPISDAPSPLYSAGRPSRRTIRDIACVMPLYVFGLANHNLVLTISSG